MNIALLSLGSNLGNKENFLKIAIQKLIQRKINVIKSSLIYKTEPWQKNEQDFFLNQIIQIESNLSAFSLLENILEIEKEMGRVRDKKWEARIIDIDILFFNQDIINEELLIIPHPLLHQRKFILFPLMEMELGDFLHPALKQPISYLYQQLKDNHFVQRN